MKIRYVHLLVIVVLVAAAVPAQARLVTEVVSYQDQGVALEGYLAFDDSISGKRPGILVVHEWWGLNDYARSRAEKLAALGYVAFALDMYGKGKVTGHPEQAREWKNQVNSNVRQWQQRALTGLRILQRHQLVDGRRIAAIGYCFGGATVQQLAYSGADIRGVVSFHGAPLPPDGEHTNLVKARILICHGAADPLVKQQTMDRYIAAMETSGLEWQLIIYGGARHSFTNPDADRAGIAALGYSKSADERSWAHMQLFFREIFR